MANKKLSLAVCGLMLAAALPTVAQAADAPPVVDLCKLGKNPAKYDGARVEAKAVYTVSYHISFLSTARCRSIWFGLMLQGDARTPAEQAYEDSMSGIKHMTGGDYDIDFVGVYKKDVDEEEKTSTPVDGYFLVEEIKTYTKREKNPGAGGNSNRGNTGENVP